MARSVTYTVVPRIYPRDKEKPAKYYAQAQARSDVNVREMQNLSRLPVPSIRPTCMQFLLR